MKEKFISKVEVIDTGKPTLFCRCPVEFSGRLIDLDDKSFRYGFIEKITVYEEDGSETEHYNQIKMANRPSNHEPYGDFLVMVMDGCSYNGDNLGKGRYDYILSQLEEKGLKFKLELFLADLLKIETGCYSIDSEIDPTKDTKGTFDYQNQIYRLGESDRFGCPYIELGVPFDKAKGAIIGEGIVVYDNKNPESVDLTEGVIRSHGDNVEVCRCVNDRLERNPISALGFFSFTSSVSRKRSLDAVVITAIEGPKVGDQYTYYGIVSEAKYDKHTSLSADPAGSLLSIYQRITDYLRSKPNDRQFMSVFELNKCGFTNILAVQNAIKAIRKVNEFSDFGFSGDEIRLAPILGTGFISLGSIPSIDSVIEHYGKSSIWLYGEMYNGVSKGNKLSDEEIDEILSKNSLFATEMVVDESKSALGCVLYSNGSMSRSLVLSIAEEKEDGSCRVRLPSVMSTYFTHQGRDILLSKVMNLGKLWWFSSNRPLECLPQTKIVKDSKWIKEHYDVYRSDDLLFLVRKESATNEQEIFDELTNQ